MSASAAEGDAQEVYHVAQMGDSYSAGNGAAVGGGSGGSRELAASGSESPSGLIAIGILALCAGLTSVLVSRARRRSETHAG